MPTYTITLTDAEDKALSYAALSQQEWIENAALNRARIAMDEIVRASVDKCLETGTQIPSSKDEIVNLAFQMGWIKSLAELQAEEAQKPIISP